MIVCDWACTVVVVPMVVVVLMCELSWHPLALAPLLHSKAEPHIGLP